MGLIDNVLQANFNITIQKDTQTQGPIFEQFEGQGVVPHHAKLNVLQDAYQLSAWVYACIYAIASSCAQVPLKVYRRTSEDEWDADERHPLAKLFNSPNPKMSAYDFWEATLTYLETAGNCYWEMVGPPGNVKEIWPLRPDRMTIVPDRKTGVRSYVYTVNSKKTVFAAEEIIHLKYFNPNNDYYGQSPLDAAHNGLTLDFHAINYNKNLFKNDATPGGTLETDRPLQPAEERRIRARWESLHRGIDKAGGTAILSSGLKFHPTAISPKDMQYIEMRRMSKEEIHAVYGVPLIMTQDLADSDYANAKAQERIFWQTTIKPKLMKLEAGLNASLVQPAFGPDIYIQFDLSAISALKEDAEVQKSRTDSIRADFISGLITRDEARARLNLVYPDFEDLDLDTPDGDIFFMPIGLIPAGSDMGEPAPAEGPDAGKIVSSKFHYSDVRKDLLWKLFVAETRPLERAFKNRIVPIFAELEKEMLTKIDKNTEKASVKGLKARISFDIEKFFFDQTKAKKRLIAAVLPIYRESIGRAGRSVLSKLGVNISFNMSDPKVTQYIKDKPYDFWQHSVDTTLINDLKNTLTQGIEAGDAPGKLKERVQEVFQGYWRGTAPASARIARTEAVGAYNFGDIEGARQSGVVSRKAWLSARDLSVRDSHVEAEQTYFDEGIDLEASFTVGGRLMDRPGDPNGGIENVANCRCILVYKTKSVDELI